MIRPKSKLPKFSVRPDELQREIWQYRRIWISLIIIFILGRLLLPHLRLLRGWEQKATLAVVEIGKNEVPENAVRVSTPEEAVAVFKNEIFIEPQTIALNGPILMAAWRCGVLSDKAACFRYLWKEQTLTLAVANMPGNKRDIHDPFAKSGWSGYLILHHGLAYIMVSSLDADEIKASWPFITILSAAIH